VIAASRSRDSLQSARSYANICVPNVGIPVQTERWRLKLQKVFALAGSFDEKPVPHRFRHTFVRILLERGVSVGDVAELIGDTERTLIAHYAKWIRSRQTGLSNILREAFEERPSFGAEYNDSR
jgi:site-specific recombinase XerD